MECSGGLGYGTVWEPMAIRLGSDIGGWVGLDRPVGLGAGGAADQIGNRAAQAACAWSDSVHRVKDKTTGDQVCDFFRFGAFFSLCESPNMH